jgi:hypothetical protein
MGTNFRLAVAAPCLFLLCSHAGDSQGQPNRRAIYVSRTTWGSQRRDSSSLPRPCKSHFSCGLKGRWSCSVTNISRSGGTKSVSASSSKAEAFLPQQSLTNRRAVPSTRRHQSQRSLQETLVCYDIEKESVRTSSSGAQSPDMKLTARNKNPLRRVLVSDEENGL